MFKPILKIRKYREPDGTIVNYLSSQFPNFIDEISLNQLPADGGIPKYYEQFHSYSDIEQFQANLIDINYSYITGEKSYYGKTLEEFIFDKDNYNNLFLCQLVINPSTILDGILVLPDTSDDTTITQNKSGITLRIKGMETELFEQLAINGLVSISEDNLTFNDYLTNYIFDGVQIQVNNQLNIASRVGFMPIVSKGLLNNIVNALKDKNAGDIFKEIALGLGFAFKVESYFTETLYTPYRVYVRFRITLFWRSESLGIATIRKDVNIKESRKGFTDTFANQYLMIITNKTDTDETRPPFIGHENGGLLKWNTDSFVWTRNGQNHVYPGKEQIRGSFYVNQEQKYFQKFPGENYQQPYLPLKQVKVLSLNLYHVEHITLLSSDIGHGRPSNEQIAFIRCFVHTYNYVEAPNNVYSYYDDGFTEILNATANVEYNILVIGLTLRHEYKIIYNDESNIRTGMKVLAGYRDFHGITLPFYDFINRITEVDTNTQDATAEVIQLNQIN
jgi:hypothetical protein